MKPKLHSNVSIIFIQSILFLEHPSTIGNTKLRRARKVVKLNNPILLKENGGSLQLTEDWARRILKSMDWVKRKGTAGKIKPSQQFFIEEKLTFQNKISGAI